MFIIDFDDTLFDTQKFKVSAQKSIEHLGISEDLYWETYKKSRNNDKGDFTYSFQNHSNVLSEFGFAKDQIISSLNNFTKEISSFLFSDTIDFLNSLKKYNRNLVLVSIGDKEFQRFKIQHSGIEDYFDKIFLTSENKKNVIKQVIKDEQEIYFINDKIEETRDISKEFSNLKTIIKKNNHISKEEYDKSGIIYFDSLSDIKNYIINNSQLR